MHIVNINSPSGWRVGSVDGDAVIDLNRAIQLSLSGQRLPGKPERREADRELPPEIADWLAVGLKEAVAKAVSATKLGSGMLRANGPAWAAARQLAWPLRDAVLAPPIAQGANILAIGLNYPSHAEEAKRAHIEPPKYPLIFAKLQPAAGGPSEPVVVPKGTRRSDYEGEIVIVIGRRCKDIDEASALDYVAGYALGNDLSERHWQRRTSEMMLGKSFDGFCPIGPWLVTADELPDVSVLRLETRVNGQLRQSAPVSDMIFSVAKIVSYLSQVMTLQPGDAILTGTPGGVGALMEPPSWLVAGDRIEVSAGVLGTLVTTMVAPAN